MMVVVVLMPLSLPMYDGEFDHGGGSGGGGRQFISESGRQRER